MDRDRKKIPSNIAIKRKVDVTVQDWHSLIFLLGAHEEQPLHAAAQIL